MERKNWVVWWKIAIFGSNPKPLYITFNGHYAASFDFFWRALKLESFAMFRLEFSNLTCRIRLRFQPQHFSLRLAGCRSKAKVLRSFFFFLAVSTSITRLVGIQKRIRNERHLQAKERYNKGDKLFDNKWKRLCHCRCNYQNCTNK